MRTIWFAAGLALILGSFGQSFAAAQASRGANPTPVAVNGAVATLTPGNTLIQFVGTHVGPKPDPMARTGEFTKFSGKVEVDAQKKTLKTVGFEIKTESVETPISKLTNHLRSPDFFDARTFPSAKFESTSISPGKKDGEVLVTGNLTLLKTTKEIQIPAKVSVTDKGLVLTSEFVLDRTEFGMSKLQDMVNKEITLTVAIGK